MHGLEAINASNGWAISIVGISIVFTGLVVLSFVISQLHKVLALYENPSRIKQFFKTKNQKPSAGTEPVEPVELDDNQKEVSKQFSLLVRTMEDHFSLSRLLHLAKISDIKHPHENLNMLFKIKIIIPDGNGLFTWNKELFDKSV